MNYDVLRGKTACFLGAVQVVAANAGKKEVGARAVVHADVSIGRSKDDPGLGLKVVLRVEGVEDQAIIDAAHEVGYSVVVTTTGTDDFLMNRCVHTVVLYVKGLRSRLRRPEITMRPRATTSNQVLVMNLKKMR